MDRSSPRKILVLTADAGFGHRSAAKAVAAALQEQHGTQCEVEIANPLDDPRVPDWLRDSQFDYDRLVREAPKLYRLSYEAADIGVVSSLIDGALTLMLFEPLRDLVKQFRPDAIVTTYPLYQAPLTAVNVVRKVRIPWLTVVTDLVDVHRLWFHKQTDVCLVPTEAVRDQALQHEMVKSQISISGIPVHPNVVREMRDQATIRAELGWQTGIPTFLVVGSKRVGNLRQVLNALNHSGLRLQLAIVAGGDDELFQHIQDNDWHIPTHVYNFVTNLPIMMHAADGIVCKSGGLIVSESIACGLPMLLIDVLPGQEEGNARFVVGNGAGVWAQDPISALEAVYHWVKDGGVLLAEYAQQSRKLGHPRAAYTVAEYAWQAAQKGPVSWRDEVGHRRSRLVTWLSHHNIPTSIEEL